MDRDESKKENVKKDIDVKDVIEWVRFYLLPIFIIIFFVIMFVFYTYPELQDIWAKYQEIQELEDIVESNENQLEDLAQLQADQFENNRLLTQVDTLVPSSTSQVVQFRESLRNSAESVGLDVTNSRAGETVRRDEENLNVSPQERPLALVEIPTEISAQGSLEQLQEFLNLLYNSQDFFVVQEMEINQVGQFGNRWEADFTLVKYQFDGNVQLSDDFRQYIDLEPSDEVIEFLNRKFDAENNIIQETP